MGLQVALREAWRLPTLCGVDPEAQGGEGTRMESGPSRLQSPRPSKLPLPSLQVKWGDDCADTVRRSLGSWVNTTPRHQSPSNRRSYRRI